MASPVVFERRGAALEWAEQITTFPQQTLLADREAAVAGLGLPLADGLALERRLGWATVAVGREGAARFTAGAGRSGEGVGGLPRRER